MNDRLSFLHICNAEIIKEDNDNDDDKKKNTTSSMREFSGIKSLPIQYSS